MLSVPSVSAMLTVIGVALLATVVLVALLGSLLGRVRTPAKAGFTAQVPAQRHSSSKTPVATH